MAGLAFEGAVDGDDADLAAFVGGGCLVAVCHVGLGLAGDLVGCVDGAGDCGRGALGCALGLACGDTTVVGGRHAGDKPDDDGHHDEHEQHLELRDALALRHVQLPGPQLAYSGS